MQSKNLTVGFFVAGGLLLFAVGLFLIGDRRQAFGRHAVYYSEFSNLAGLANGAKVQVGGMAAGEVLAIEAPSSPASRFRVMWRTDAKLRELIRDDSVVSIDTEGVVGGSYLAVRPGSMHGHTAAAFATIPSKEPVELAELLSRGNGLLAQAQMTLKTVGGKLDRTLDTVDATVSNVNGIAAGLKQGKGVAGMLLSDDKLAGHVRRTITSTTANADQIVTELKAGRGPAGMLLRDEALGSQIRQSVKNVEQTTADLMHASSQVDTLVSDLGSRQFPKRADEVVSSLSGSARQVQQLIAEATTSDRQGMTAGANIRESLANANAASLNMADATEALKHNFLVRGFFKERGYYNLDRIPPEKYRQDRAFANRANHRAWLAASDLFQVGPSGQEELSPGGKSLIDSAFAEHSDAVVSPIIVEGYCGGDAADQIWRSRTRAILVRQYLQSRFHLDSAGLGIVALKSEPPKAVRQSTWDGICIVVRRTKKA